MAARVAVYAIGDNKRSRAIAEAMACGIRLSDDVVSKLSSRYEAPEADVAVFYGFDATMRRIFAEYRADGRTCVCIDLGYWGRREGGILAGHHKVAVNARHPTAYFQNVKHGPERAQRLGLEIKPWKQSGRFIIVAGMSGKGAEVEGFEPSEWERRTVAELKSRTNRPIIYRPKPSWVEAVPMQGCRYERGLDDLPELLEDCHAVVTHHSNAAIDAMLAGVPAFTTAGAASVLCPSDLSLIETPVRPEGREQFVNDLAYTQFTVAEMRDGTAWRHLKEEGLVP